MKVGKVKKQRRGNLIGIRGPDYCFAVDLELKDILEQFWAKGWRTKYSCAGHFYRQRCRFLSGYIYFESIKIKNKIPPKGTVWCENYDAAVLRWYINSFKELSEVHVNVLEWAKTIEPFR